jgi:hypothetical protein
MVGANLEAATGYKPVWRPVTRACLWWSWPVMKAAAPVAVLTELPGVKVISLAVA